MRQPSAAMPHAHRIDFSVVIPLFNKRPYIRRTLESALAQEHPPSEVIIVDDGSTDGGPEAIADLLGPNVRLVRQENSGPGPARNRGIAEARFGWIAFLDGDDLWTRDHLSTLARLIRDFPSAAIASTSLQRVPAEAGHTAELIGRGEVKAYAVRYFQEAASREVVCSSSVAVRRDVFEWCGQFGSFWPGEDVEFWARIALDNVVVATRKVTALYVVGTGGLMDQSQTMAQPHRHLVFDTIERALADERYASIHSDLTRYRRDLLLRNVRQALYRGDAKAARAELGQIEGGSKLRWLSYRLLAALPHPVMRLGIVVYSAVKHLPRGPT